MNLLFFDIECATCRGGIGKICEFGYVLADENFNILKADNFLINPRSVFDWYTTKKILHYSKKRYQKSPDFGETYERIASVLKAENQVVLGQATKNDMKFLKDECIRYKLPYIDVKYGDVGYIFKVYENLEETKSIEKMCESLGIVNTEELHQAVVDAKMTMEIFKALCAKFKLSPLEMLSSHDEFVVKFDFNEKTKNERKRMNNKKVK